MPKIHVSKSIDIEATPEKIYAIVSDFHKWRPWSPWLVSQPDATVNVRSDGKYYEWHGHRVGSGSIEIAKESAPSSIDYNLTFLKPWKSKATFSFDLAPKGVSTGVSWTMDSSLPFFMFWMKNMMTAFIGADYERGLMMLKEYAEDDKISSELDFKGDGRYDGCSYVGVKTATTMENMSESMTSDFQKLWAYLEDDQDNIGGLPFCIYHKWDMVKGKVAYTAGVPLKALPSKAAEHMTLGHIPPTNVHTVRHIGSYRYLGNAWSTLYTMQRNKEFKMNKKVHPFETYLNNPGEVSESELITEVHFPTR